MLPTEVFRFVALRAPRRRRVPVELDLVVDLTPFAQGLLEALRGAQPRDGALRAADRLIEDGGLPSVQASPVLSGLERFHQRVMAERPSTAAATEALAAEVLGAAPSDLVADPAFRRARLAVRDAVLALKLRPAVRPGQLASYTRILLAATLVDRLAAGSSAGAPDAIALLRAPLVLPREFARLPPAPGSGETAEPVPADDSSGDSSIEALASRASRLDAAVVELSTGSSALTRTRPAGDVRDRILLADSARAALSATTRTVVESEGLSLVSTDLTQVIRALEGARAAVLSELSARTVVADDAVRARVGTLTLPPAGAAPALPLDPAFADPSTRPPTTVGPVRPSGVGQLLVTRQQITRYEGGEVSHVENVLRSESRNRGTRRLRRTEESFVVEQEQAEEEERDLQSTERFEMQSEIEQTLAASKAFEVGASVSAGYGPFVQVEASTGFASDSSTEQSESMATSFARELVEQTVTRISQRVRTQQTRTLVEEFEETNSHGFDNSSGAEHVVGIYQWLDRVYEMQIYDYGLRLIFEFTVPEPAALYLNAVHAQLGQQEGVPRPKKVTFRPSDLTATNYGYWAREFRAEGIKPPPAPVRHVSHVFSHASAEGHPKGYAAEAVLTVPPGYRAVAAWAAIRINRLSGNALPPAFGPDDGEGFSPPTHNRVDVLVGNRRLFYLQESGESDTSDLAEVLGNVRGELPVAVAAANVIAFAATVTVECLPDAIAYEEWQLATFEALVRAQAARMAEYHEQIATLAAQAASEPKGRNPTLNRMIERNEIKRLSISMLSGQRFKSTSVPLSPQAAEFDFDRALATGNYARFWESAIEWRTLDYTLHPYYWARPSTWGRLLTEDVDPLHAAFVSAGAATVRLAATPGFEAAVLHFLETGEIWNGGDLPEVTSPDYVAFLDELAVRREPPAIVNQPIGGRPPEETPVGEPWEVRLPTTLVRLRPDGSLPAWARTADGRWLPAEELDA